MFLDRDGVINRAFVRDGRPFPPTFLDELEILPDVPEALSLLKEYGFLLIVVTNQPDVGRGTQKKEMVDEMHTFLKYQLPLDDIFVCWHAQDGECDCRKPKPGMLLEAADRYNIDLEISFMIGDRWRDIDAGYAAGCSTIFINRDYKESLQKTPDVFVGSFAEAAEWICKKSI